MTALALKPPTTDAPDWSLTSSGTYTGVWTDNLDPSKSVKIQLRFDWGSGASGVKVCVQSSLDGGNTGFDVAYYEFAAVSRKIILEVTPGAGVSSLSPGEGGLDSAGSPETEGIKTTVFGDMFRIKIIQTGSYVSTTLSARLVQ